MNKRLLMWTVSAFALAISGLLKTPAVSQPFFSETDPHGIVPWLTNQGYLNPLSAGTPLTIVPTEHTNCQSWLNDYRLMLNPTDPEESKGVLGYVRREPLIGFERSTAVARLIADNSGRLHYEVFVRPIYDIEDFIRMPLPTWSSMTPEEVTMLQDYARRVFEHELGHHLINRDLASQFNANASSYRFQVEAASESDAIERVIDAAYDGVGAPGQVLEIEGARFGNAIASQQAAYDRTSTMAKVFDGFSRCPPPVSPQSECPSWGCTPPASPLPQGCPSWGCR